MIYKQFVGIFLIVVLAACSKPTIDISTDEATKLSIEKVRNSLTSKKKAEFDEAMRLVAMGYVDPAVLLAGGVVGVNSIDEKIKQTLKGKTADDIIEQAEQIKKERAERERSQALVEIKELEAKQASAEKTKGELEKFEVVRARFYKRHREYIGLEPIIEITVKNGTGKAISHAYFEGTLSSKGRSVPWLKEEFNYSISGGLEPGEGATWRLAPNSYGVWGKVETPSDAVLTVNVIQLDGVNSESHFSIRGFGKDEAARLTELKRKYDSSYSPKEPVPDFVVSSSSSVSGSAESSTPPKLSKLNLNSILIQQGDLPAGFSGDQILYSAPGMYKKLPVADNTIFQQIAKMGESYGSVAVFLFEDKEKITSAYNQIVTDMLGTHPVKGIGEKAYVSGNLDNIAFVRLNAVVHIHAYLPSDADIPAYAARLDSRLEKLLNKQ